MTLSDFKTWLDGFCDAIGDAPTPEQWAKVLSKLDEVQADVINLPPDPISPPPYIPMRPWDPNIWYGDQNCPPHCGYEDARAAQQEGQG